MGKILVVAEKPSVGRDIAKVLGCSEKGEGCLTGEKYIVTWAIGHLVALAEPEEYDEKYKRWSFETLPIIPEHMELKTISKTRKQFTTVKKLMNEKEVESLICATDSGREGELIFRYIYIMAKCKKPYQRLWISSMTDVAIREGFVKLKDGREYDNLYESARCRSEADWLVGMNASRAFTIKYKALLSIGRVQTPTLAIIVQRQREIDAFVPQDYYEVKADFGNYNGVWFDKKTKDTKIFDNNRAVEIAEKIKDKNGKVINVESEEKKQHPPLLYDLTELQRDGNKKFGFSAKKTLSIAQDLYEKRKLITYPRTDSRYLSDDMIPKLKSTLNKLKVEPYSENIKYILGLEKLPVSSRIINNSKVTDHHAIIPTDVAPKIGSLSEDERKIYDLIVKRFMAEFYPDYKYTTTRVTTEVEEEAFLSKGKTVSQLGWMELYKNDNKRDKNEEQELPNIKIGDDAPVKSTKVEAKKTQPPSLYTDASLLSAMENPGKFVEDEELKEELKEWGLGTPATRAAIIERLLQVGYIKRKGKMLEPTEKGMSIIEIVPPELKSPEMTGKWERGLNSISKGKMKSERFMESIVRYVNYIIQKSQEVNTNITIQEENKKPTSRRKTAALGKCPLCKEGSILENTKAFYCSEWKSGCKFTIWKNSLERYGIELDKKLISEIIKNGRAEVKSLAAKKGEAETKVVIELADEKGNLKVSNFRR